MTLALTLAAVLFVAPLSGYHVMQWSHQLRQRLLLGLGFASTGVMLAVEPGLGLLLGIQVWRWRRIEGINPVLIFGATCGIYAAVMYGPGAMETMLPAAIVAGACVQAVLATVQYLRSRRSGATFHVARDAAYGTVSSRVILSILCALACPLAPLWALPVLVLGLVVTSSWIGLGAALAGLLVAYPTWAPAVLGGAIPVIFVVWVYRGGARDSWHARVAMWGRVVGILVRRGWPAILLGLGAGGFRRQARWWRSVGATPQMWQYAHNDVVQVLADHGLVGVLGVMLWGASLARGVHLGDPLTGALVAGVIGALGQFPAHVPQTAIPLLAMAGLIARRVIVG